MDDFGSILYVAFTIIAIVFSIIKKNNKKAKPPVGRVPSTEHADPFSVLMPEFGESNVNVESQPFVVSSLDNGKKNIDSFEEKKRDMESKMSRIKKVEKPSEVEKLEVEKLAVLNRERININLRQAVIYSEILKRPYQ